MLCGKMLKITFLLLLVYLGSSGEYVKAFLSSKPVTLSAMTSSSSLISKAVKEASFGMGCFWEPAEQVKKVEGVIDTVSGYTGNKQFDDDPTKKLPSYENVCYGRQWVEAVRVTFDDNVISYEELLEVFFEKQKPQPQSRQYSSMIFPRDKEQYDAALNWYEHNQQIDRRRDSDGFRSEWTTIEFPRTKFYSAEGYVTKINNILYVVPVIDASVACFFYCFPTKELVSDKSTCEFLSAIKNQIKSNQTKQSLC